jgi:hypothetical protein
MLLFCTSVLFLARERRVQARQDNVVKVTAKFIRKGTHFQQTEVGSFLE